MPTTLVNVHVTGLPGGMARITCDSPLCVAWRPELPRDDANHLAAGHRASHQTPIHEED